VSPIRPREAVARMRPYRPPLEGRRSFLRLDFNENTRGAPPAVAAALSALGGESGVSVYPEYGELRQRLARRWQLAVDQLLPTNASDDGIRVVLDTFLDADEEIVIPVPTFAMFRFYAEIRGAAITEVLYNETDLSFPEERVLAALERRPRVLVLVSPNNPTGTEISPAALIRILDAAGDHTLVLLDEAYWHFAGRTALPMVEERDNLVVLHSFSKAMGQAGLRFGYLAASSELMQYISRAASPYGVNSAAVACALATLDSDDWPLRYAAEVREARVEAELALERLGIEYFPGQANFVLARLGDRAAAVCSGLEQQGILVRDRSGDPLLDGCVRLGVGTREETSRMLSALEQVLGEVR